MKILVINGDCIEKNSSANLCHLAYIHGLLAARHEVYLLSADGKDYELDSSIKVPHEVTQYKYYGVSLYEKMSMRKQEPSIVNTSVTQNDLKSAVSIKSRIVRFAKDIVLSMYGVYGIYAPFVRKAKRFRSEIVFDCVISLSTPPSSHLLAEKLINSGNVKTKKWIQIWEDPWWSDVYGFNNEKAIYREEKRLLGFAQYVCYVSPLTLANQKKFFPEAADKMFWQPVPYYYKNSENAMPQKSNNYGYFGDYYPVARNLEPFFQAASNTGISVNICGNPSNLFSSTHNVHVHPRLAIDQLKPLEDMTNVLIFLCNRKGGQIPGKIYQYSATNKTILFILDGTDEEKKVIHDFFGKFNRYLFCENNVDDIIAAINKIELGNIGSVKNIPLENFNPKITIESILNFGE